MPITLISTFAYNPDRMNPISKRVINFINLSTAKIGGRMKEVGIRKVLGSSVSGIVFLLTSNYTRWVIVTNLFARPVAYFTTNRWLQSFVYRTSVGINPFIIAALSTLVVALLSVILQTMRVATANPVHSLRYE
jgi:putative ABC transport system permease protein